MKCKSCDVPLTNREISRKSLNTDEYLDMCNQCLGDLNDELEIKIKYRENVFVRERDGYDDE